MRCASPNLTLPCEQSRTAPKNKASASGVLSSHTAFSKPAMTAIGIGKASHLSLQVTPLAYDAMRGVAIQAPRSSHSVMRAKHWKDFRAVTGEVRCNALSWVADLWVASK